MTTTVTSSDELGDRITPSLITLLHPGKTTAEVHDYHDVDACVLAWPSSKFATSRSTAKNKDRK